MAASADPRPPASFGRRPPGPAQPVVSQPKARIPRSLDVAAGLSWRFLVTAAAIAVVGFIAYRLRPAILTALAALLLSSVLAPIAAWLRARRWPPLLATLTVVLGAAAVATLVVVVMVSQVAGHLGQLGTQLQEALRQLQGWVVEGPLHVAPDQLDRARTALREGILANASTFASGLLTGATLAIQLVAGAVLAVVLTFFFVKDGDRISSWALTFVPSSQLELARRLGRRAFATLGSYVRGSALLGLVEGTVVAGGLAALGVPLAAPLGVLTFAGAFFPLVGSLASGTIAALIALVNGGPVDALLVVALVVVVNQADAHILQPLVMGKALRLHPVALILALAAGGGGAGLMGAFLAVPFTAVVAGLVDEVRSARLVRAEGA